MQWNRAFSGIVLNAATCVAVSQAGLTGTAVTGSLRFVGNTNFFDPASGKVPSGYGNSSTTTPTVADPQIEFGFQDNFSRITADFTNLQLTISEQAIIGTDATIERYRFVNSAFSGLTPVLVSNTYPVGPTTSLVDDTLTISLPDNYSTTTGNTTTLKMALTLPGDANLNGAVDFNDFLVLQNNFGAPNTSFAQGNFNGDGLTDFNDFLILQNNFGQSIAGTATALTASQAAAMTAFAQTSGAVPEPSALALIGLASLACLRRARVVR